MGSLLLGSQRHAVLLGHEEQLDSSHQPRVARLDAAASLQPGQYALCLGRAMTIGVAASVPQPGRPPVLITAPVTLGQYPRDLAALLAGVPGKVHAGRRSSAVSQSRSAFAGSTAYHATPV